MPWAPGGFCRIRFVLFRLCHLVLLRGYNLLFPNDIRIARDRLGRLPGERMLDWR